ncbi:hypothetical protein CEXT_39511 [Caerostris extrusa]|uniref:Uncharacterized protein n=1 Tax=Caerostris extrusa TaxID=172846 RepID=A0AAV4R051_CAEEX|nr:hypothetical protein CEXT_39511 [Caerostris extrusa]
MVIKGTQLMATGFYNVIFSASGFRFHGSVEAPEVPGQKLICLASASKQSRSTIQTHLLAIFDSMVNPSPCIFNVSTKLFLNGGIFLCKRCMIFYKTED